MSEQVFVLKARWPSSAACAEARPKVEIFFERMARAYDKWQVSRRTKEQLDTFKREFADVLKLLNLGPDCNQNDFAGELESPFLDEHATVDWKRSGFRIMAEVWSGTDWTRLCAALKKEFGAEAVSWREARLA